MLFNAVTMQLPSRGLGGLGRGNVALDFYYMIIITAYCIRSVFDYLILY